MKFKLNKASIKGDYIISKIFDGLIWLIGYSYLIICIVIEFISIRIKFSSEIISFKPQCDEIGCEPYQECYLCNKSLIKGKIIKKYTIL